MKNTYFILFILLASVGFGQTESTENNDLDNSASFPTGKEGLYQFIAENFVVPEVAIQKGLSGKLVLKFVVTTTGDIVNVKVVRKIPGYKACTKEAIRVLEMMPDWIPAKMNGEPVNQWFTLPFKIQAAG